MKGNLQGRLLFGLGLALCAWPLRISAQEETDPKKEAQKKEPPKEAPKQGALDVQPERPVALTARVVLKVIHPSEVQAQLLDEVKKLGGYPSAIADEELVLRVPPQSLNDFLDMACKIGWPLDKKYERQDLGQPIAQLEATISAKRDVLEKLQGFFNDADVETTVKTERKMTDLVEQLEALQGELRYYRDRARLALVVLRFQSRKTARLEYRYSPFDWINTASLKQFLQEF